MHDSRMSARRFWIRQVTSDPESGGGEGEPNNEQVNQEPAGDDEDSGASSESLGDAGKQALDRMKRNWHGERDRANAAEAKLAEKDKSYEAVLSQFNKRYVRSEVKAAAKGKLSDPGDAFKFLNLDDFKVSEDGEVDGDAINTAIDDLLKSKPYLGAQRARAEGSGEGGARSGDAGNLKQLSRADLATMTPEQILAAKEKGQLKDLLKQ